MQTKMHVHYLEIVTSKVDQMCALYRALYKISFSEPVAELGNARTAKLEDGGILGVRAPLHADEKPEARPYWLVEDAQIALDAVVANGATIAHPVHYELGGVMQGLWQL